MKIIGLTGGSGAGKSTVSGFMREAGCTVLDADAIYHALIESDSPCSREIIGAFGNDVRKENGGVDRRALREIVFDDPAALSRLNAIAHSHVKRETARLLGRADGEGVSVCVIDAPQLFEAGMERLCDSVWGVVCSRVLRTERIMRRDGISESDAEKRLSAQHDDIFFEEKCDVILRNDHDAASLRAKVLSLLSCESAGEEKA